MDKDNPVILGARKSEIQAVGGVVAASNEDDLVRRAVTQAR
jgi:hypothetical protein